MDVSKTEASSQVSLKRKECEEECISTSELEEMNQDEQEEEEGLVDAKEHEEESQLPPWAEEVGALYETNAADMVSCPRSLHSYLQIRVPSESGKAGGSFTSDQCSEPHTSFYI